MQIELFFHQFLQTFCCCNEKNVKMRLTAKCFVFIFANVLCIFVAEQQGLMIEVIVRGDGH